MKWTKLTAGLSALALLVAGCGSAAKIPTVAHLGSSGSSASSSSGSAPSSGGGSSSEQSPGNQALAYTTCMHSHGVPNFPEPTVSTSGSEVRVAVRVTPSITGNPHFNSAQQACRSLMPGGGPGSGANHELSPQEQSQFLKAAACIRAHGVPNFPDPTFSGGGVHLPKVAGLNPRAPQVRTAEEACQALIPGGLHGDH